MSRYLWEMRPYFRQVAGQFVLGSLCGIVMNTAIVLPALLLGRAIDTALAYSRGEVDAAAVRWAVLIKPFAFEELVARIRARLRGRQTPIGSLSLADLTLDLDLHEAERGGRRISLTATEVNLLEYLLRHPSQILSKEAILLAVWGYDFGGDSNIVEQYVRSLRQKLGEPQLLQTVRLAGYVAREPGA